MDEKPESPPEAAKKNPVGPGGLLVRDVPVNVGYPMRAKAKAMRLKYDGQAKTWIAAAGTRYGDLKAAGFSIKAA